MPVLIHNKSVESVSLPFPLGGVLKPGQKAVVNLTMAQATAYLGSAALGISSTLALSETSSTDYSAVHGGTGVTGTVEADLVQARTTSIGLRPLAGGRSTLQAPGGTIRVQADTTGLSFFAAPSVAQQAAQAALTPTVAGDMPGPTAAEITARLNLIETRLNEVSEALRNLGLIAT